MLLPLSSTRWGAAWKGGCVLGQSPGLSVSQRFANRPPAWSLRPGDCSLPAAAGPVAPLSALLGHPPKLRICSHGRAGKAGPWAQHRTGESPLDGPALVLEALAALLPGAPGAVQRGGRRDPGPQPAPLPRLLGRWLLMVDALRLPGAEHPSSLVAPRTERPSLTPCALLSCTAGARVPGEDLCLPHPGAGGCTAATTCPPHRCPLTGPDGFLPCAKSPGSPGPGGPPPAQLCPPRATSGSLPACGLHPRSSGDSL
ncbi:uncharacterized protein LOC112391606 [Neophocaena asiaeorientalis asiaeorientalis]|uniref:Uncharacterized protein LOC112391606 n=1 Tax=Neophocaena asiaeorientalis asiaeorientalis TaxID=1706337 RepID=A0A341ADJ3_NEOAA|nr:uncharacterized protein LOC112391606 [Neophocaena asiaeorientalis asiaeorientalis]